MPRQQTDPAPTREAALAVLVRQGEATAGGLADQVVVEAVLDAMTVEVSEAEEHHEVVAAATVAMGNVVEDSGAVVLRVVVSMIASNVTEVVICRHRHLA